MTQDAPTIAFRPLRLGPLTVNFPVFPAPMAGFTDLPYRLICRRRGAEYCVTEMMLDRQLLLPGKLRRRLATLTDEDHPVGGQIIGNDPAVMAESAKNLGELGFDVADLNFACPVHKALSRRRGGHLLRQPAQVLQIIRAVVSAASVPVTIKLRRSFLTADIGNDAFWEIAEGAFAAGVAAICVHARSVEQKYTGRADWAFLASVKKRFPDNTVIGSGDVLRPVDALAMFQQTGVDGVAVARGALGNPWFFRQVRDLALRLEPYKPTIAEQRELIQGHFTHACELYGHERGPKIMRKFCIKYARLHPTPSKVRTAFIAVHHPDQIPPILEQFYGCESGCE